MGTLLLCVVVWAVVAAVCHRYNYVRNERVPYPYAGLISLSYNQCIWMSYFWPLLIVTLLVLMVVLVICVMIERIQELRKD